ncbi:MAG: hypothetical protein MUE80_06330 [Acidobacteria bacterium]|jgi:hypothetical protein|nr:hypothetical protein [Acidobacteriota bacterium]
MKRLTLMKLGTLAVAVCLALVFGWGVSDQPSASPVLSGPYLGQTPPGDRAALFAPGTVSTGHFEHSSPVFTPDLKEIYWSVQITDEKGRDTAKPILFMKETGGRWSRPETATFAKAFACAESPFIEPGGMRLFFHAGPALRSEEMSLYDVPRDGDGWGVPVKLAAPLNERRMNGQPTVAANGTIYFAGDHRGDIGLYSAKLVAGRYLEPVPMDEGINARQTEWTPYVAPDESYFIFCSFRPGGHGSGDLYIVFKREDGAWGRVLNMGSAVNTGANERFPNVTPDGKYLFFNSTRKIPGAAADAPGNGNGDVYWIDARIIEKLRAAGETR